MVSRQQLQQIILKWEIELSQLEIRYFDDPVIGDNNRYHILYLTIQKSTNKIYIGVHSSLKLKDNYIGCGITCNILTEGVVVKRALKRSHLWRAVKKYGIKDFVQIHLAYFFSRAELIKAEKVIVTKEFIQQPFVFNNAVGGGMPPINSGARNGNYNNKWSEQQKKKASDYFRNNINRKRGNNNRAKPCISFDLKTKKIVSYGCGRDLADALGFTHLTIATWLRSNAFLSSAIRKERFICFIQKDYELMSPDEIKQHINNIIEKSKLSLNLKNKYKCY